MAQVTVAILGAGARGRVFARLIEEEGDRARIVAVAEPREAARRAFAAHHRIDERGALASWQDFVEGPRRCDAVVVSTMDRDHVGPALACLKKGYHLLLEKPMATSLEDCRAIEAAQRESRTIASVCHSLRYHQGFSRVKEMVDQGRIGEVVSVDQLEQVAYWHYAHSYVRGNWGNELDYICYLVGRECTHVASFGALSHFLPSNAPLGSTERCTDGCEVESSCRYSATRLYVGGPLEDWLFDPETGDPAAPGREARSTLLRTSPYGRCVWRADNDVVDHQVVLMRFEGGVTATFTMAGMTEKLARRIRVHGTTGELEFEENGASPGDRILLRRFGGEVEEIVVLPEQGTHGGADRRVVRSWLDAMHAADGSLVRTSIEESLRSHTVVFAAEAARHRATVEKLVDWQVAEG
jgi:predicted dehydrogenase